MVVTDNPINLHIKKRTHLVSIFHNIMDDESNKRQRTDTSSNNELHINDLSDGLLVGIASYLAKPSVALFAIAMKPNNSHPSETSRAIISSTSWNVLDFSDIEKSLASKLSDNDIDKILRSIDAVNNLKILKLAGCINITGSGLLRSSVAIQQIDMSLVGKHESPLLDPEPLLLQTEVLPMLDDIISRGRASSLKHSEFPKKWRDEQSTQMDQFIQSLVGKHESPLLDPELISCNTTDRYEFSREA